MPPVLLFLIKIALTIWGLLNIRIVFFYLYKKCCCDFDGDCIRMCTFLWVVWNLSNINSNS